MNAITQLLTLSGVACILIGQVFDYCEYKYNWPPRLPLRWIVLGVFASLLPLTAAVIVLLVSLDRR